MTPYFLPFLFLTLPYDADPVTRVDCVEINHMYNEYDGTLIFDQVVVFKDGFSRGWVHLPQRDQDGSVESDDGPKFKVYPKFRTNKCIHITKSHTGKYKVYVKNKDNEIFIFETLTRSEESWTNYDVDREARHEQFDYNHNLKRF